MAKASSDTKDHKLSLLMSHYIKGVADMDIRRTRKNGWNEVVNAYMSKLPANWPYTAMVTDPRIRTTLLEKTARLLNAKLQGRLVPREGGDVTKARIQNAVLDFQWDYATEGGSMIEKVAQADQISRLFGAAFVLVYWDNAKECNEIKVIDPRDVFCDFSATHLKNAHWVQVREFTTLKKLEEMGYDLDVIKDELKKSSQGAETEYSSDRRSSAYESIVKVNRGLEDRVGEDRENPVLEVVTQYEAKTHTTFLPRYKHILIEKDNPYKHGQINLAMLRYYPLGDDIYGESEAEPLMALQRAINAFLCGSIDEMNLSTRPPVEIVSSAVRMETIEFGPGARWIVNQPGMVREVQMGGQAVQNFSVIYPALVAAFNNAAGDQSLGVSNATGEFAQKTATEVVSMEKQQNSRDQYNQLYLSEFLKDIMLMWLSNNKQYLFDDPTKKYKIIKIIGKDNIQALQSLQLDDKDIPDEAMAEIAQTIESDPMEVSDELLNQTLEGVAVPTNPVVENPNDQPEDYIIHRKLDVKDNGEEADLYLTPDDFAGTYDYVPDVKAMSAGAGMMLQQGRQQAIEMILNPQVQQLLALQGESVKIKELLVNSLEDNGYKDAESLFQPIQQAPAVPGGPGAPLPGQMPPGANANPGIQGLPQAVPVPAGPGGLPQPVGLPGQAAA